MTRSSYIGLIKKVMLWILIYEEQQDPNSYSKFPQTAI